METSETFAAMYATCVRPVLAYCLRRTSESDAHDATAEVSAVAWRRRRELPVGDETLPWLYGVAANVLRNQARSSRRARNLVGKIGSQRQPEMAGPETQVVRLAEYAEVPQRILAAVPGWRWSPCFLARIAARFGEL